MSTDKIADMATRIRNAYLAKKDSTTMPHTKLIESILKAIKTANYIKDYSVLKNDKGFKELKVDLLYVEDKPALSSIKRISKPGVRVYSRSSSITPVLSGYGTSILSTSKGIMTNKEAKKNNIGGELLIELY